MRFLRVLPLLLLLTGFALRSGPATLYLTGDSTLAQKLAERRPETGWGEALQQYFDIDRVRVENHARNGRSTRTFLEEGRWQAVVDRLKPGDYVFVQFGHNDASRDRVDRYTPPEDYRRNLVRFVREARAKGAHPVLLTPVMRRRFDASGTFQDSHGEYPDLVRAVAAEHRVPLLDMHRRSEAILRRFGVEGSRSLFLHLKPGEYPNYPQGLDDNTHFSPFGAEVMAAAVVEGIRELGIGLAERLSPGGRAVTTARFAPPAEPGLLAPARISALPPEEREAWERYLAASRRQAEVDRRVMAEELRAAGLERPTPAPHADGFGVEPRMTAGWFRGEEARRIADAIVSFQTPAGGWSKRMEFTRARRPGESWASEGNWSWIGTFDNGATTSQLRFLAGVTRARGDERYRASFLRGLGYTLAAQFPNGCWPQVYPLAGAYHDAATYNDDAMVRILRLLQEAGR
ncbi:MAG TPA: pectate lyase, partial [Longimicrobiaceae bacterium]|nr:pectate lyase [Longimicrobiaceae bacterium]